uniref:Uncharacterized protein n=2 Tax=viral metagenome TaxID=1070528 RepID=A0A6M3KDW2_9ZZZZ
MKRKEVEVMNKYRLSADSNNIILQEKQTIIGTGKKKPTVRAIGDTYWNNIAFFANPKNALTYIIEEEIRELWVEDLKEVVKRMEKLEKIVAGIPLDLSSEHVRQ